MHIPKLLLQKPDAHQIEFTDLQTSWNQKDDGVNSRNTTQLPYHQPIRDLCMSWLIEHPGPSLSPFFTNPFLEAIREFGSFWMCAAHSPCLAPHWEPCNKPCTFLHHNLVSVDWLYWERASRPRFGSVQFYRNFSEKGSEVPQRVA